VNRKPVVYLAGPYSHPEPIANMRDAIELADRLFDCCAPLIPHLTGFWHLVSPRTYEEWLELDCQYLEVCDALLRFGGGSLGADKEVALARELGKRVFFTEGVLREWVATWTPE
jgi:hypothetical protein